MNVNLTWAPIGAGGLVALFFVLFYTGRVVARSTMDRIVNNLVEGYEGRIRDKDRQIELLSAANSNLTKANNALLAQHQQSLDIGLTTGRVIASLSTVATSATTGGIGNATEVA